jgi:hypothetical protein
VADWKWFAGEAKGRCPHCTEPLRRADMLVEIDGVVYHVHCGFDYLIAALRAARSGSYGHYHS